MPDPWLIIGLSPLFLWIGLIILAAATRERRPRVYEAARVSALALPLAIVPIFMLLLFIAAHQIGSSAG